MTPIEQVSVLSKQLIEEGIDIEITDFPSGAVMMHVGIADRTFVLYYSPTHKMYGVDEVAEDDYFSNSYRFCYPDFDSTRERLNEYLRIEKLNRRY